MKNFVITKKAYGKTNLFLRCLRKREDSFTEIETLFLPVPSVCDTLSFSFDDSGVIRMECDNPSLPCDGGNLCVRAAEKFLEAAKLAGKGVTIHLEKHIPIAAGMGGGSSDAACTLLALQEFFGCLSEKALALLALSLGSDVPFFLRNTPCIGTGRGELLTPILPRKGTVFPLLFAAPGFPVSAKWAYTHLDWARLPEKPVLAEAVKAVEEGDIPLLKRSLRNDLQAALLEKFPLLQILFQKFRSYGGTPLVSGSGPTVFALFESEKARDEMWEKEKDAFDKEHIVFFKG